MFVRFQRAVLLFLFLGLTVFATVANSAPDPLISREVLFGNPQRMHVRLSPQGKYLSFVAPSKGVLNIWLADPKQPDKARVITADTKRGIRNFFWSADGRYIIYIQDKDGDENWQLYSIDLSKNALNNSSKNLTLLNLTPFQGVQARIYHVSPTEPEYILIGLNNRIAEFHDVYKLHLATGNLELVLENNDEYSSFEANDKLELVVAGKTLSNGSAELYLLNTENKNTENKNSSKKLIAHIPQEDIRTTHTIGLDETGKNLYLLDSRKRNTTALTSVDLDNNNQTVIYEDPKLDIQGILSHPKTKSIQAVATNYQRVKWNYLDKNLQKNIDFLKTIDSGDINIVDCTYTDQYWIVAFEKDNGPLKYYYFDKAKHKAHYLFSNNKALEKLPLTHMHPVTVKSNDGLDLVSYLSLPRWEDLNNSGRPKKPLPLVLVVHGGPIARDEWGFNNTHQWLANRGYAVISVNYRGSTGFGKEFINASNGEWAGKMHQDLIDVVDWAIKENITTVSKVAIMGGSYGGYAALVGLTFTPDVFAAGIDIVGPSNLQTLLQSIPPYWKAFYKTLTVNIGGHLETEAGRNFLASRSPITYVDQIKKPLLIGQGANDPRVKQAESDQIVQALQDKNIPVTYVLYPDEGHGFARPENRLSFYAVSEAFLGQVLGGRVMPADPAFKGSSIEFVAGKDFVAMK